MQSKEISKLAQNIAQNIQKVIFGKEKQIRYILTSLFCKGHILLDDVPGTGKTSLAKALAKSVSADCTRIQFTPDLLPSDITGINYFNQKSSEFVFRRGPVFTNILIADEINRATPRTQSALLESMEEHQATIDGVTYKLDELFFVIATQNPIESQGTFPLPEAQTDRFFMKLSMGYPDLEDERGMMHEYIKTSPLDNLDSVCTKEDITAAQEGVRDVIVSDPIKDYILDIINSTRTSEQIRMGVSPRGTLALMHAAQAYAAIDNRDFVIPDDVKAVAVPVLSHRIISRAQRSIRLGEPNENLIQFILETVRAPI